jgi:hypothetical protein
MATGYTDDKGGGWRSVALTLDPPDHHAWVGELTEPLDGNIQWRVALRSWSIPPMNTDKDLIVVSAEYPSSDIDTHLRAIPLHGRLRDTFIRGEAETLRWVQLEKTHKDITGVAFHIRQLGADSSPALHARHWNTAYFELEFAPHLGEGSRASVGT